MSYAVKEVFATIQGEGFHAGTPAVFVRFAGCNMWSGEDVDRERDAVRNGARCPMFCDTDFVGGEKMTAGALVGAIHAARGFGRPNAFLVVFTGGEPLLQMDAELMKALRSALPRVTIAIETNGTVEPKFARYPHDQVWITMSPKVARGGIKLRECDEIKIVVPDYNPSDWVGFDAKHWFVQPRAALDGRDVLVEGETAEWVQKQDLYRISVQTHKVLGVR